MNSLNTIKPGRNHHFVDVVFGTLKNTPTMIWYQGYNRYDTNPQSDTQVKFRLKYTLLFIQLPYA